MNAAELQARMEVRKADAGQGSDPWIVRALLAEIDRLREECDRLRVELYAPVTATGPESGRSA